MKEIIEIERKIKPLVDALNSTNLVRTFSSCQGHYENKDQELQDKNFADVRFDSNDNCSEKEIEKFLNYLIVRFNEKHSFYPISLGAQKIYSPNEDEAEPYFAYVIKITPFERFDNPDKKRKDTDIAIKQVTNIINEY